VASAMTAPKVAQAVMEPSSTSAGGASDDCVRLDKAPELRLTDANTPAPDADGRQLATINHVSHRLLDGLRWLAISWTEGSSSGMR
jgi:hypothetical protein